MAFPADVPQIEEAERQLGRTLPRVLRERLMRNNGGEIRVAGYVDDGPYWTLHPVWDGGDRKRIARTAGHIVRETREAHETIDALPDASIVIAGNGTGDLLLVLAGSDDVVWWDHETGGVEPVAVDWA
ncbi:MAG: SMI1/KNR4 family protein [Solirubrobacteraceae bacterium]